MIKSPDQMTCEIKARLRGGAGDVEMLQLFDPDELTGRCRLIARLTLQQGCSIGYHQHDREEEIYYVIAGEGLLNDNGTESILRTGDASLTGNGGFHSIQNNQVEPLVILAVILVFA